jgi:phospholipase A1/A2
MYRPVPCLLATALAALALPTLAQTPAAGDCAALADDVQRLACYDKAVGRKPAAAPVPMPAQPAQDAAAAAAAATAAAPPPSALDRRRAEIQAAQEGQWFSLTAHRTNYVLPVSYIRSPNWNRYEEFGDTDKLKDYEAKYQLSLKTPLWPSIGDTDMTLWLAFTLQSWWQAYASDISAPFRETNYEPEIFLSKPINYTLFGVRFSEVALGLNHQSNGRTDPLSRSWNRATARVIYDSGNFAGYVKAWARFSESEEDDDNPNIERYMGQAEFALAYRWREHTFAGILKNNLRSDNKSGLQLDWTFPLLPHLKGYVQGYTGYGESLIDGDRYVNRIGLGLMLADWF